MKDIGEEVAVMGDLPLPDGGRADPRASPPTTSRRWPSTPTSSTGSCATSPAILDEDGVLPETDFWALVAGLRRRPRRRPPGAGRGGGAYDLLRPDFRHSCLNRLQLRNTLQMVDLTDQAESLIFAGTLANPIAMRYVASAATGAASRTCGRASLTELAYVQGRATARRPRLAARDRAAARRGPLAELLGPAGVEWDTFARRARLDGDGAARLRAAAGGDAGVRRRRTSRGCAPGCRGRAVPRARR